MFICYQIVSSKKNISIFSCFVETDTKDNISLRNSAKNYRETNLPNRNKWHKMINISILLEWKINDNNQIIWKLTIWYISFND